MNSVLFGPEAVASIVFDERFYGMNALEEGRVPSLKDRVIARVKEQTGISGKMPQRIQTWIHQLCLYVLSDIPPTFYDDGNISKPLDLNSLPKNQRK